MIKNFKPGQQPLQRGRFPGPGQPQMGGMIQPGRLPGPPMQAPQQAQQPQMAQPMQQGGAPKGQFTAPGFMSGPPQQQPGGAPQGQFTSPGFMSGPPQPGAPQGDPAQMAQPMQPGGQQGQQGALNPVQQFMQTALSHGIPAPMIAQFLADKVGMNRPKPQSAQKKQK